MAACTKIVVVDGPAAGGTTLAGPVLKTTGTTVAVEVGAGDGFAAGVDAGAVGGFAATGAVGLTTGGVVFGGIGFPVKAASMRVVAFSIESRVEAILSTFKFETPLLIPLYHFFFAGGAAAATDFDSVGAGTATGFCEAAGTGTVVVVAAFGAGATAAAGTLVEETFGAAVGVESVGLEAPTFELFVTFTAAEARDGADVAGGNAVGFGADAFPAAGDGAAGFGAAGVCVGAVPAGLTAGAAAGTGTIGLFTVTIDPSGFLTLTSLNPGGAPAAGLISVTVTVGLAALFGSREVDGAGVAIVAMTGRDSTGLPRMEAGNQNTLALFLREEAGRFQELFERQ